MKRMTIAYPSLFILCALLCGNPVSTKAESARPKRMGAFTVRGTLLYDDHTPYGKQKIFIVELSEKGNPMGWIDEKGVIRTHVAVGLTDGRGRFVISVPRINFRGDKLRFSLFLGGGPMQKTLDYKRQLKDKSGVALILEIDERAKLVDMDKSFGSILIQK